MHLEQKKALLSFSTSHLGVEVNVSCGFETLVLDMLVTLTQNYTFPLASIVLIRFASSFLLFFFFLTWSSLDCKHSKSKIMAAYCTCRFQGLNRILQTLKNVAMIQAGITYYYAWNNARLEWILDDFDQKQSLSVGFSLRSYHWHTFNGNYERS